MKTLTATLFIALVMTAPCAVSAQSFSSVGTTINPLQPLAPPACPPTPTYTFCDSLKQQIDVYNHYASVLNEIQRTSREAQQYMRYPTTLQSNISQDVGKVTSIMQQAQGLSFLDKSIDASVQTMMPSWNPGYSTSNLDDYLEGRLENSVTATLTAASGQNADISRDSDIVDQIKAAAASGMSPTQTGQMTVQLLGVMYAQMVREQQSVGLKMSQEAAFDLQQVGEARVQRQASQAQGLQEAASLYPVPPTLTQAQVQQILNYQVGSP
jgi:hypothetical protein